MVVVNVGTTPSLKSHRDNGIDLEHVHLDEQSEEPDQILRAAQMPIPIARYGVRQEWSAEGGCSCMVMETF